MKCSRAFCQLIIGLCAFLLLGTPQVWAQDARISVELNILAVADFYDRALPSEQGTDHDALEKCLKLEKERNSQGTIILHGSNSLLKMREANHSAAPATIQMDAMIVSASEINEELRYLKNSQSKTPYLGANVLERRRNRMPAGLKPYTMIKRNGINIGIIGIVAPIKPQEATIRQTHAIEILDPSAAANEWVEQLKGKGADVVIVLSDLECMIDPATGELKGEAAEFARRVRGVDLLITKQSEQYIVGKVNGVPIVQAGYAKEAVGRVHMVFSLSDKTVISSVTGILDVPHQKQYPTGPASPNLAKPAPADIVVIGQL